MSMNSLKGYTPALAQHLGTTPAALYERQRELVRAGILDAGDGRGPGSGVRATGAAVALLLIAVLATDSLSETGDRVGALATAKTSDDSHPFAHTKTLVDSLAFILTSKVWSKKIVEITIKRTQCAAIIKYREGGKIKSAEFLAAAPQNSAVQIEAAISGATFREIAADVWGLVGASAGVKPVHNTQKAV
jgi:hypothetical protein